MPHFMIEASYGAAAAKSLVDSPQKRAESIAKTCQSLGGRLHSFFFAFGDYDSVTIVELPSNEAAAALALSVGASGALTRYRTTVLMTADEGLAAMRNAKSATYAAPR
jgi:uncharacterized protein with GYD domain